MGLVLAGKVLADCASEEEDHDDGGGNPEGAVEVGVTVEDIEERGCVGQEREESGAAAC